MNNQEQYTIKWNQEIPDGSKVEPSGKIYANNENDAKDKVEKDYNAKVISVEKNK